MTLVSYFPRSLQATCFPLVLVIEDDDLLVALTGFKRNVYGYFGCLVNSLQITECIYVYSNVYFLLPGSTS